MIDNIKEIANKLLDSGIANVIIGYGHGSAGSIRPIFVTRKEEIDTLIFNEQCSHNLAVYLFKPEIRSLGKPALIATVPVVRSLNQLIAENQISEGDITVIAISPDNQVHELNDLKSITFFTSKFALDLSAEEKAMVEKIEQMTQQERWDFWAAELSKCIKCYACRAACPLCYCSRCTVDCNQPQWISVPAHPLGNMEWHIMRAMHLAGRCSNCGACYRACPMNIPLNLLTQKLIKDITKQFVLSQNTSENNDYPLSTFKPNDNEDFIR